MHAHDTSPSYLLQLNSFAMNDHVENEMIEEEEDQFVGNSDGIEISIEIEFDTVP